MDPAELEDKARGLICDVVDACHEQNKGSLTLAIYDTAWVSMVSKVVDGRRQWLFPECFQFVLDRQRPDGGWESYASEIDGILNTMAALLAMKRHYVPAAECRPEPPAHVEHSIVKAIKYLKKELQRWDVEACVHVGFEILVPSLLSMLEQEQIHFSFPGRASLMALHRRKLDKFHPDMLYGSTSTTLLHSLEAFVGKIDFDRVSHHLLGGSMLASPSSTAAYLMNASKWAPQAEIYLRKAILKGGGNGSGGLPCVFPCNIFELTWVTSTLLHAGFSIESLGEEHLSMVGSYLEKHFQAQGELVGFAPLVLPDADDTAKTILTLNLLGKPACPKRMITYFKANHGHLMTYLAERNPSFSANCNGLMALLHAPDVQEHAASISALAAFLCDGWWDGTVQDKWNLSPQYSMMLLASALMRLLRLWDDGRLPELPEDLMRNRVPVVLTQILNQTLFTQDASGAWGSGASHEVTAYAVLTLSELACLPWVSLVGDEITYVIQAGRDALIRCKDSWAQPQYVWVEKVTYGSTLLASAYCLAAMKASTSSVPWNARAKAIMTTPYPAVKKLSQYFARLLGRPEQTLKPTLSIIEGCLFLSRLKSARTEIFPRPQTATDDYLMYIPPSWTIVNNLDGRFLHATLLWDMMELSMQTYLVDEYMEGTVARLDRDEDQLESIRVLIHMLCDGSDPVPLSGKKRPYSDLTEEPREDVQDHSNGAHSPNRDQQEEASEQLPAVWHTLMLYIKATLGHARVRRASRYDQVNLRTELRQYLLAHLVQLEDNERFTGQAAVDAQSTVVFRTPRTTYHTWAHTVGAEHISGRMAFAYYACLVGSGSPSSVGRGRATDCFPTVQQKYLACDLGSHVSIMSRLYNDYGSIARDRAEGNLNSINFPEFHGSPAQNDDDERSVEEQGNAEEARSKTALLDLARYERQRAQHTTEVLVTSLSEKKSKFKAGAIRLFVRVAELYGDMYVARDLTNKVR
ncbi:MAG: hypothetical protein M1823_002045 [Watsoniomyces obsoletus]|nr:MAG: hypothetical protein M1823_002045 [Watsoniomyces obsoletus]